MHQGCAPAFGSPVESQKLRLFIRSASLRSPASVRFFQSLWRNEAPTVEAHAALQWKIAGGCLIPSATVELGQNNEDDRAAEGAAGGRSGDQPTQQVAPIQLRGPDLRVPVSLPTHLREEHGYLREHTLTQAGEVLRQQHERLHALDTSGHDHR